MYYESILVSLHPGFSLSHLKSIIVSFFLLIVRESIHHSILIYFLFAFFYHERIFRKAMNKIKRLHLHTSHEILEWV